MASNKAIDLGVMTRVENLRSIWPDEARFEQRVLDSVDGLKKIDKIVEQTMGTCKGSP